MFKLVQPLLGPQALVNVLTLLTEAFYYLFEILPKGYQRSTTTFSDLLNEGVARDQQVVDDYEGDDAADGQIENHHYPVVQRGQLEVSSD